MKDQLQADTAARSQAAQCDNYNKDYVVL